MSGISWPKALEFLVGFLILPRVMFLVLIFIAAYFSTNVGVVTTAVFMAELVLIVILFLIRKPLSLGYATDFVLGLVGVPFFSR